MAVEQSPNSIVITNLKAEIEYANRAFFITGYTPERSDGVQPQDIAIGQTPRQHLRPHVGAQLKPDSPGRASSSTTGKTAAITPSRCAFRQCSNPMATSPTSLAIKEDITRQKQAEQQIYKLAFFRCAHGPAQPPAAGSTASSRRSTRSSARKCRWR